MKETISYEISGKPIKSLTQWDTNQTLVIKGLDMNTAPVIHFCNKKSKSALVVQSELTGSNISVKIPNILLQQEFPIIAYIYVESPEYSFKTVHTVRIPIDPRVKPDDYKFATRLIFMSEDGSLEYGRELIVNGSDGNDPITNNLFEVPEKPQSAQYTYTFDGWSLTPGGLKSESALKSVTTDRYIYAHFANTIRSYTVRFINNDVVLETKSVNYGSSASYTGETPVKTGVINPDYYEYSGWLPSPSQISGDTDCFAQFDNTGYIEDDWDVIAANVANGSYTKLYGLGAYKELKLGSEIITVEIVDLNHDDLSDGSGKAGLTFICKDLLSTARAMNTALKTYNGQTGFNAGGWGLSDMRNWLNDDVFNDLPNSLKASIKAVNKTSDGGKADPSLKTTSDKLWLLSCDEVGINRLLGHGTVYPNSRQPN